jgi:hypothetical protein
MFGVNATDIQQLFELLESGDTLDSVSNISDNLQVRFASFSSAHASGHGYIHTRIHPASP